MPVVATLLGRDRLAVEELAEKHKLRWERSEGQLLREWGQARAPSTTTTRSSSTQRRTMRATHGTAASRTSRRTEKTADGPRFPAPRTWHASVVSPGTPRR